MTIKKVLNPQRVYLCIECPHRLVFGISTDTFPEGCKVYYGCNKSTDVKPHEFPNIPEECPLEDWEE